MLQTGFVIWVITHKCWGLLQRFQIKYLFGWSWQAVLGQTQLTEGVEVID